MPRKCIVKVILSKEQKEMLEELARRLGISESETMHGPYGLCQSLMEERVRRRSPSASSFDSKSTRSIS